MTWRLDPAPPQQPTAPSQDLASKKKRLAGIVGSARAARMLALSEIHHGCSTNQTQLSVGTAGSIKGHEQQARCCHWLGRGCVWQKGIREGVTPPAAQFPIPASLGSAQILDFLLVFAHATQIRKLTGYE